MINYKKYYEVIKDFVQTHPLLIIFFFSFFLYITCGLYMSFYNDIIIKARWDLLYGFDSGNRYLDFYTNKRNCWGCAHPFSSIIQPIIGTLWSLLKSSRATMIVSQSLIGALSCLLFFSSCKKLFSLYTSFIFSVIFIFCFSNIISTSIPDIYIYGGITQLLFLTFTVHLINNKNTLNFKEIIVLSILTCLSFGIHLSNIILSLTTIIFILALKNKNDIKKNILDLLKIFLITALLIISFTQLEKQTFKTQTFVKYLNTQKEHPYKKFFNKLEAKDRIAFLAKGTFIQPFYAMKTEISKKPKQMEARKGLPAIKTKTLDFSPTQNIGHYIPFLLFIILPIIFSVKNTRKIHHKNLILYLALIIAINSICNYYYEVTSSFLFSQNNLCYLVLLIALLYSNVPKKITVPACLAFLAYQIPINFYTLHKIQKFISQTATEHHSVGTWMLWALIVCICFGIIGFAITKLIKKEVIELPTEKKYLLYTSLYLGYTIIYEIFIILFQGRA